MVHERTLIELFVMLPEVLGKEVAGVHGTKGRQCRMPQAKRTEYTPVPDVTGNQEFSPEHLSAHQKIDNSVSRKITEPIHIFKFDAQVL